MSKEPAIKKIQAYEDIVANQCYSDDYQHKSHIEALYTLKVERLRYRLALRAHKAGRTIFRVMDLYASWMELKVDDYI